MNQENLHRPPIVPIEYAGKWIAWDRKLTHIVASCRTFEETVKAAEAAGEPNPVFAKVPKADLHFVGTRL